MGKVVLQLQSNKTKLLFSPKSLDLLLLSDGLMNLNEPYGENG